VLSAHAVRGDELGCHQFDGVAVLTKEPRPLVRASSGFHADQARWLDAIKHTGVSWKT
jgi:hypothetical protein